MGTQRDIIDVKLKGPLRVPDDVYEGVLERLGCK
jgi:hypothetical protein